MKIGELSRATGVDTETIRFYEKSGLLQPPAREPNGYRAYGPAHVEALSFIRHCRALDIPLAEVRQLIDFSLAPREDCGDVNRLIDTQLARVRERLQSLRSLERQLAALRSRCPPEHAPGDCGILQELVSAAHGDACICHAR